MEASPTTAPAPGKHRQRTVVERMLFIGETYSHLFSTVNLLGFPSADVRRFPRVQVPRRWEGAAHPPARRRRGLLADATGTVHPAHDVVEGC